MRSGIRLIERAYGWFLCAANACQSLLLLAIRLYWGWQFSQAGWGKVTNIPHVTEYFTSLGVPAPALNAYFISWLEVVGGILLALGLFSRLIALPLTIDMIVAFIVGDREALGSVFSDPDKFYAAAPYTFLFASILILFFGPGKLSLDTLIVWYRKKRALKSDVAES
ncbi:MAG: DoxX family protein [Terriglobia bacterium]|jgi:putative oxidoreductase